MTKKSLRKLLILSENRVDDSSWLFDYYDPINKSFDRWHVNKVELEDYYDDAWNNNPDRLECAYIGIQLWLKTEGVKLK